MKLPAQRHRFDIPSDVAYFNCAYMSPLLDRVFEAGELGLARKRRPWEIAPSDFFDDAHRAREKFATLINADANGIAIIPAASYGLAVAAKNLPIHDRGNVVVLAEQFPSNVYVWREAAKRANASVREVARPPDDDWTPRIVEGIDERTDVVALPHCHWTDGTLIDLTRVRDACDQVNAALVLDLTQSAGALPFDCETVRPDFVVCAGYKWLLAPYSIGFMYAAPQWREGEPIEYSWIARAMSEDFSGLVNYRDDFQPGAIRYDVGERANFALLPAAIAALDQLLEWNVQNIAQTLGAITDTIAAEAATLGLLATDPARRANHFLGLRFEGGPPDELLDTLAKHRIYVSVRGDAIRVTPHLYNTESDVDQLLEGLRDVVKTEV
ncbi:MAG: aminotransferase class V-fold PLP-dependent enzyme [Pseudomonadota bacterium]